MTPELLVGLIFFVSTALIFSMVSIPSTQRPNTAYPHPWGVGSV